MTSGERRLEAGRWIDDFALLNAPEREHLRPGDRLRLIEDGEVLEIVAHGKRRQIPPRWVVVVAVVAAVLAWWLVL